MWSIQIRFARTSPKKQIHEGLHRAAKEQLSQEKGRQISHNGTAAAAIRPPGTAGLANVALIQNLLTVDPPREHLRGFLAGRPCLFLARKAIFIQGHGSK